MSIRGALAARLGTKRVINAHICTPSAFSPRGVTRQRPYLQHTAAMAQPQQHGSSSKVLRLEESDIDEHSIRGRALVDVPLVEAAMDLAGLDLARATELVELGAVYSGLEIKGQNNTKWTRSVDMAARPTDAVAKAGLLVRVHPEPKRFPVCNTTNWPSRVVHMCDDYVVVNKPADVLCMRHTSNAVEEVAWCVAKAIKSPGLEVCHRLDQWTTGVLVLSRTKDANRTFKRALEDRTAVSKTYKALTCAPVALGTLEHYMFNGPFNEGCPVLNGGVLRNRGPRLISDHAHPTWQHCKLEEHEGAKDWFRRCYPYEEVPETIYESTILLHTGRTHQIRAQLAATGTPLIGDTMYGPIARVLVDESAVITDPQLIARIEGLATLTNHIGLHSWRMTWQNLEFEASPPWEEDSS